MGIFQIILMLLVSSTSWAQASAPRHGFTAEQSKWMAEQNAKVANEDSLIQRESVSFNSRTRAAGKFVPYGEYQDQGYLLFSDGFSWDSLEAKRGFLSNLPNDITPIIFTINQSPEYIESLRQTFGRYLKNPSDLVIMYLEAGGNPFWARDGIPVPGFYVDNNTGHKSFTVIDAKYYHYFEPDEDVAGNFSASLWSHNYYFEGGNFMANESGDCLVVNNETVKDIPTHVFKNYYGCTNLVRLPYIRGIGHADESVKFISEKQVITDLYDYKSILEDKGFEVIMIPRAKKPYETYINSVILGSTVYLPSYNNEMDLQAVSAYRSLGYEPVLLNSSTLSNRGYGSLHCISMVYPNTVSLESVVEDLGAEVIH